MEGALPCPSRRTRACVRPLPPPPPPPPPPPSPCGTSQSRQTRLARQRPSRCSPLLPSIILRLRRRFPPLAPSIWSGSRDHRGLTLSPRTFCETLQGQRENLDLYNELMMSSAPLNSPIEIDFELPYDLLPSAHEFASGREHNISDECAPARARAPAPPPRPVVLMWRLPAPSGRRNSRSISGATSPSLSSRCVPLTSLPARHSSRLRGNDRAARRARAARRHCPCRCGPAVWGAGRRRPRRQRW